MCFVLFKLLTDILRVDVDTPFQQQHNNNVTLSAFLFIGTFMVFAIKVRFLRKVSAIMMVFFIVFKM